VGIRETLNKNPQITTVGTAVITLLAIAVIVWQLMPGGGNKVEIRKKAFYTIDEGKNWFDDDMPPGKMAPFMYQGKEAVRAHVFRYGDKGPPFVQYLEKYTPQVKTAMEQFYKDPLNQGKLHPDLFEDKSRMIMKPGKPWVPMTYQVLDLVLNMPEKNGEVAQEIFPE
jgi:hypothetical protein